MEERRFLEIDDCKTIEMAFARSIRKGGVRIIATRNRSILRIGSISEVWTKIFLYFHFETRNSNFVNATKR